MILDILQIINNHSKIQQQIFLQVINKNTHNNMYIHFLNISECPYFGQLELEQKKFGKLKKLNCTQNKNILNVNHLQDTLEILYCGQGIYKNGSRTECRLNQNGISRLKKLRILNCHSNEHITNVNHLCDTLEELYCANHQFNGINQDGISRLKKLKVLDINHSKGIYDVNHLCDTLIELDCGGFVTDMKQEGISKLKHIKNMSCSCNRYINDVSHLASTLKILRCGAWDMWNSEISQNNIEKLKNIEELYCNGNYNIYDVNHLADTLKILDCSGYCKIDQKGISRLKKLEKINCDNNQNINYLSHLSKIIKK